MDFGFGIAFCVLIFSIYRGYKKAIFKRQKYLYFSGRTTLSIFVFLFVESMLFRILCDKRSFISISDLSMCKRIAKSLHFGASVLTSPSLCDLSGYTGSILRWLETSFGTCSAAYISTGIVLLVAPLSTTAWIVSLLNSAFWENAALMRFRLLRRRFIVFYDSSDLSINIAHYLKQYSTKKDSVAFCRFFKEGDEISKEKLEDIYSVADICLTGTEREYQFGNTESIFILCVPHIDKIYEYITPNYNLPIDCRKLFVISNEPRKDIDIVMRASGLSDDLGSEKCEKAEPISYMEEMLFHCFIQFETYEGAGVVVTDGDVAHILRNVDSEQLVNDKSEIFVFEENDSALRAKKINKKVTWSMENSDSILNNAYWKVEGSMDSKYIAILNEDTKKNISQKRKLIQDHGDVLKTKNIDILVYCKDKRTIAEETRWDKDYGKCEVKYIGEEGDVLKDIAEIIHKRSDEAC